MHDLLCTGCFGPLPAACRTRWASWGEAQAQEAKSLTFLQISDSHIGFHLPPNPNALGTLEKAIAKVANVTLKQNEQRLAIIDTPLQAGGE